VLELAATEAAVVACFAEAEALDALAATDGAVLFRAAPDEAMLVGDPRSADDHLRAASAALRALDPHAIVLDASDGWAIWTLAGDGAREAFRRLSALAVDDGTCAQGDVARVPARVMAQGDRVHLFVAAMWEEYLRGRIIERCASIAPRQRDDPWRWGDLGAGGRSVGTLGDARCSARRAP
jgi:hypothetical protein